MIQTIELYFNFNFQCSTLSLFCRRKTYTGISAINTSVFQRGVGGGQPFLVKKNL